MNKILVLLSMIVMLGKANAADFTISVQSSGVAGGIVARKLYDGNGLKFAEVGLLNQEKFFLTGGSYSGYILAGLSSDYSDLDGTSMPLMFVGSSTNQSVCLHDQQNCAGPCKLTIVSTTFVPKPVDAIYKKNGVYYKTMKDQTVFSGYVSGISRSFGTSCQNLSDVPVPNVFEGQGYITSCHFRFGISQSYTNFN